MSATTCGTCRSGERAAIEHSRASGATLGKLSKRFRISKASLQRHFSGDHVPPIIRDQQAAVALCGAAVDLKVIREQEQDGLLRHIAGARSKLYQLLDRAGNEVKSATAVHNAITGNLKLMAACLGQIGGSTTNITNNVLCASLEYLAFRGKLIRCLSKFPEARKAVAEMLRESEVLPEPEPIEVTAIEVAAEPVA